MQNVLYFSDSTYKFVVALSFLKVSKYSTLNKHYNMKVYCTVAYLPTENDISTNVIDLITSYFKNIIDLL